MSQPSRTNETPVTPGNETNGPLPPVIIDNSGDNSTVVIDNGENGTVVDNGSNVTAPSVVQVITQHYLLMTQLA